MSSLQSVENDILKTIQSRALGWRDQQPHSRKSQDRGAPAVAWQGWISHRLSFWVPPRGHVLEIASLFRSNWKENWHDAQIRNTLPVSAREETREKGNTPQAFSSKWKSPRSEEFLTFLPFYVSECTIAREYVCGVGGFFLPLAISLSSLNLDDNLCSAVIQGNNYKVKGSI